MPVAVVVAQDVRTEVRNPGKAQGALQLGPYWTFSWFRTAKEVVETWPPPG